jgi:hypothetical protein
VTDVEIDGWDLYLSDSIVVQNSYVFNDDDCVSFKPNSTNIVVQNMVCIGSHGISVGSLGQYLGEVDLAGESSVLRHDEKELKIENRESLHIQHFHVECRRRSSHQGLAWCRTEQQCDKRGRRYWVCSKCDV